MKQLIKYLTLLLLLSTLAIAQSANISAPDLSSSSDSGITTDNITNKTTLTFTGSKESNETVTLYRDDANTTLSDKGTGTTYSISISGLAEGTYNFAVSANDGTVESALSPTLSVTIDRTFNITIDLDTASDSGQSNSDKITNDNTPKFIGTLDAEANVTINGILQSNSSNSWNYTFPAQNDGTKTYTVSAIDTIGNTDSASISVTIDTNASIQIASIQKIIKTNNLSLTGAYQVYVNTDIESSKTLTMSLGSLTQDSTTRSFSFDDSASFVDGQTYTLSTASGLQDIAGNVAPVVSTTIVYDKTPNESTYAKSIELNSTISEYLDANNSDTADYFIINVPKKGRLNIETNATDAHVKLLSLNNTLIADNNSSSITKLINRGSYLVKVSGTYVGSYGLTTLLTPFDVERDEGIIPTATKTNFSISSSTSDKIFVDGEMLYRQNNKYDLNNTNSSSSSISSSNKYYLNDEYYLKASGSTLSIQSVLNSNFQASNSQTTNSINAISILNTTAYTLIDTNSTTADASIGLYDLNDLTTFSTQTPTQITLSDAIATSYYNNFITYTIGADTYAYISDTKNHLYVYKISNSTATLTKYFDNLSTTTLDFSIENNLLYIATSYGVKIYDLASTPETPVYLTTATEFPTTSVSTYDNTLYVLEGSQIVSYNIGLDYDDNATTPKTLNVLELNATTTINKYSGKNDVDIFRVDLEYVGDLNLTFSGIDSADLNITIDDNASFTSPIKTQNLVSNATVSLTSLSAKTYYIKLKSGDINSYDTYTLTSQFTKEDTADVKDALLNISLAENNSLDINSSTLSKLSSVNDVDIYQLSVATDGNLTLTIDTNRSVTLNSAQINSDSNYLTLSSTPTGSITAGNYYLRVSGQAGDYNLTTAFTSYDNTDESTAKLLLTNKTKTASSVGDIQIENGFADTIINATNINNTFISRNSNILYNSDLNKTYLSQVSDGRNIYGLYRYISSLDSSVEIGIDTFEYTNDSKVKLINNKVLTAESDTSFAYKLKIYNNSLMLRKPAEWVDVNTSQSFIASEYIDFDYDSTYIYAITSTKLDKLDRSNLTVNTTKTIESATSIALNNDTLYVGTSNKGLFAYRNTLVLISNLVTLQKISQLTILGNDIYAISGSNAYKLTLRRDFSDDFANAKLIALDTNITGRIDSTSDNDYFKIVLANTGELNTTTDTTCTLYNADLVSLGSCSQGGLASGTYYFDLNNTTPKVYSFITRLTPLQSDIQDSLSFFDDNATILTTAVSTFKGKIDISNDIDMFKVTLSNTGLVTFLGADANISTLLYENGTNVSTNADGKYLIVNSGTYFIKVTSQSSPLNYELNATFEAISNDKYVDKTIATNSLLSSTKLNDTAQLMLSNANTLYLASSTDGINIVDISNPTDPKITSRVNLTGTPLDIALDGTILYVALGNNGYAIVDVSNPNEAQLINQVDVLKNIKSITAHGSTLYLLSSDELIRYDISKPTQPKEIDTTLLTDAKDVLQTDTRLYIADATKLKIFNRTNMTPVNTFDVNGSELAIDGNTLFVGNDNNISILDVSNENNISLIKSININSSLNQLFASNKSLYLALSDGYRIIEYKDLQAIAISELLPTNNSNTGITFSNSSLILSTDTGTLNVYEGTADYPDSIISQSINNVDIQALETITGQFSRKLDSTGKLINDVDTFRITNVTYTGTFELNISAPLDVNITLLRKDGTVLKQSKNDLNVTVNEGDFFIQIEPSNPLQKFSYEYTYKLLNDGELDILSTNVGEIKSNGTLSSNLYTDGGDKDYYRLNVEQRGVIHFTSDNTNVKISLIYPSGTLIATNDEGNNSVTNTFEAELIQGSYYVLVEDLNKSTVQQENYVIKTSFSNSAQTILESGASDSPLNNFDAIAYTDKYIYILNNGILQRKNSILETYNELSISELSSNNNAKYKIFVYKHDGNNEDIYISYINQDNTSSNSIIRVHYSSDTNTLTQDSSISLNQVIFDEEVMSLNVSNQGTYISWYDGDVLYIANTSQLNTLQILQYDNLKHVLISGTLMYLYTDKFLQILDVSDMNNIDSSKILATINTDNIESIFVDSNANRLFIGANNKIEIWNISDKKSPTLLNEFSIHFNDNALYYEGTPTSFQMFNNQIYATIKTVGLVIFNINSINEITYDVKRLNLGENLTNIHTSDGVAVNYLVENNTTSRTLKVEYFASKVVSDPDSSGTYTIQNDNSIKEGCFIATAAYGSYFEKNVQVLRDFRDNYLKTNSFGRYFVSLYYHYSPSIAKQIADNEFEKSVVRIILTPIVYFIKYPLLIILFILSLLLVTYPLYTRKKLGEI